ncbi:glycerophosphodiester phosphodiesterase [Hymenobacter aquaticus]|uniref:Glycerophosphodiester phosphodiesterase n=1 Tax=Hymenobacter aquaticus TaxID=1867101 RepID=A0A4Z0PT98_9BACT|nr:glycerophosphodiester phosphodiesterase family protein [Hymenobacter aquaticus]TGE20715.1 glycerophosphodiester phosphodiesterase [Hymenobacter aquaticus]
MPDPFFPRPQIHGHRGCRGLFPENTLPAFQHAVALGIDVLELDVVVSADGQVVVSHEPWFSATICRLPTGEKIPAEQEHYYNIYQLPYAQIRQFDCGLTRHPGFPRQQNVPACKPLLREVIQSVEAQAARLGRPPLCYSIEVKTEPGGDGVFHPAPASFVPLVLAVAEEEGVAARVTLLSFDLRVLRVARPLLPALSLCLLIEGEARPLAEYVTELGFVPEVLGPDYHLLTPALSQAAHDLGMQLVPWTVNDADLMRQLIGAGITGITTDYPDLMLAVVNDRL